MPQLRALESLQKLCVSNVAKNIDYWCRDYIENWLLVEHKYIHIIGPFHLVPSCLLEQIIEELNYRGNLRSYHLHVLIVEHLQKLFLQRKTGDINGTLKLLSKRCKGLKSLNLANYNKISHRALNSAIIEFPHLKSINLSYCHVLDHTVSVISAHCKNLRHLNLRGTKLTDFGLFSLFLKIEDSFLDSSETRPSETRPSETCLEFLDVRDTYVTSDGVRAVLLKLPNLKYLLSEILLISLTEICLQETAGLPSSFQLKNIQHKVLFDHASIDSASLSKVIEMCPNAQHVICYGKASIPDFFSQFEKLHFISELDLDSPLEQRISFATQVLPILKATGKNITKLCLGNFSRVDIPAIEGHCPAVECLSLHENTYLPSKSKEGISFKCLVRLELHSVYSDETFGQDEDYQVARDTLLSLLSSPFLGFIYFSELSSLTDSLFADVLRVNAFPNLESLSLEGCNLITKKSVFRFLRLRNPMYTLVLRDCELITRGDSQAFLNFLDEKDLQVKIIYI